MQAVGYMVLGAALCCCCTARYQGLVSIMNASQRDGEQAAIDRSILLASHSDFVECPVCTASAWLAEKEECNISVQGKKYKHCKYGTYVNEICGDRRDCYAGPNEKCTENVDFRDVLGKKCARGYYCDKAEGVCVGVGAAPDLYLRLRDPANWWNVDPMVLSHRGRMD